MGKTYKFVKEDKVKNTKKVKINKDKKVKTKYLKEEDV
jgi:hypothetical protein